MRVAPPLFSLQNVSYRVDGKDILSGITVDIGQGEYIGIIGPNGGGKTTLLRLMLGLSEPTAGKIVVNVPRAKIGYVPQRASSGDVTFPATVLEVIESGIVQPPPGPLLRTGGGVAHRKEQIHQAMKKTSVTHLSGRRIGTLSGGERQRVMIARALAGNPDVLFLDEPTAAIDPGSQEEFYTFLRKLHDTQKMTIVMVSHDTDAISHEVQRVLCLNRHLVCHGHPGDVMHNFEHYGH